MKNCDTLLLLEKPYSLCKLTNYILSHLDIYSIKSKPFPHLSEFKKLNPNLSKTHLKNIGKFYKKNDIIRVFMSWVESSLGSIRTQLD